MRHILVFGDGHASGMELNDSVFHTRHPGMKSYQDIDLYDKSLDTWYQKSLVKRSKLVYREVMHAEYSLAFPATMQRLSGIQVTNLALPGLSQQHIHLTLMDRILKMTSGGVRTQDIGVVLSLAETHSFIHRMDGKTTNIFMGAIDKGTHKDTKNLHDIAVEFWTEDFLHTLYVGHVLTTISFLKARGIRFEIVDGKIIQEIKKFLALDHCSETVKQGWAQVLEMIGMSSLDDIPSMRTLAVKHQITNAVAPGNHFGKEVHDLMAAELVNRFTKSTKP